MSSTNAHIILILYSNRRVSSHVPTLLLMSNFDQMCKFCVNYELYRIIKDNIISL